jgi:DNA (cytosine-5)-methyltransferase 1
MNHKNKIYPDMSLYQEIILLKYHFKGLWIVENVIPYYKPLITPSKIVHRHSIWSNFKVEELDLKPIGTCKVLNEREFLQKEFGYNLDKYSGVDKRLLLRNCVVPEMGLHILNCSHKETNGNS